MKYLVTGGAGFIGSHLCAALLRRRCEVVVLDNFSSGRRSNLAGLPVRLIEGDVRDARILDEAVRGVDVVFHQAALCSIPQSLRDPVLTHEVNATGTLNVLEASRRANVRRVVTASSAAVYGDTETLPKHEDMRPLPLSPYAISKLVGEHYCKVYWKVYGLETVALRYFNVFGPRQRPGTEDGAVIPAFLHAILHGKAPRIHGDGSQTRDFVYVDNVVQANLAAASSQAAAGKVINVACGDRWSLLEVLERIGLLLDRVPEPQFREPRAGELKHSQAALLRAQELLAYSPSVGLEEGLRRTLEWLVDALPERRKELAGLELKPLPLDSGKGGLSPLTGWS